MSPQLLLAGTALLGVSLVTVGACRQQPEAPPPAPAMTATASIRELMLSLVDPSADVVWNSVGTIVSEKGAVETAPHTDEEWAAVRYGALRLAEATNLLMIPGRASAPPGSTSAAPGVELESHEIEALIAADRDGWNARAKALLDASLETLRAIDAKNPQELFNVGEEIEMACEGCHSQFWYPNQPLPGAPNPSRPPEN